MTATLPEDTADLAVRLRRGERRALAQAITLAESARVDHRMKAERLLSALMPETGRSLRLGISGPPGAGKSTFIEAVGQVAIDRGYKLAILAVDPSSNISGGSILGDKVRMAALTGRPEVFIRPSPSGMVSGGVARRTREAILLAEAAGFDLVIVETVGVGQSETEVAAMTDMFLLLLAPMGGDMLQGIKRGVMELADLVIVNKADGNHIAAAQQAAADYSHALRLMRPQYDGWQVEAVQCSALNGDGISEIMDRVENFRILLESSGILQKRRVVQATAWLWAELKEDLIERLKTHPAIAQLLPRVEADVRNGEILPTMAARKLLDGLFGVSKRST